MFIGINMKKVLVMLLFFLLLVSFVNIAVVSAVEDGDTVQETDLSDYYGSHFCKFLGWKTEWICSRLAQWEPGFDWQQGDKTALAIFFKYMMLILIIIMVYSVLNQAKFPKSSALQFIVALILGFILTFMISSKELVTALTSYSALGITLVIFFPIMILGFFTLTVASKTDPFGIYIQKIAWIIYASYLLLKTGALALGMWYTNSGTTSLDTTKPFAELVKYLINGEPSAYADVSNTVLVVLFIVSIAVLVIMVWKDDSVVAWFAKEKREAENEADKAKIDRADKFLKNRAEQMEKG